MSLLISFIIAVVTTATAVIGQLTCQNLRKGLSITFSGLMMKLIIATVAIIIITTTAIAIAVVAAIIVIAFIIVQLILLLTHPEVFAI